MKLIYQLLLAILSLALFFSQTALAASPRLYIDPATATVSSGSTTTLELKIDTAGQEVSAADAKITFPPATIGIVDVTAGDFFPKLSKVINSTTGLIDLHGYFDSEVISRSGNGSLALITIKGTSIGLAELSLSCTVGLTTDSNIADLYGKDIIDCAQSAGAEITVKSAFQTGGSPVLTPIPTPSTLPQAGGIIPTIGLLTMGIVFFTTGTFLTLAKEVKS